MTTSAITAEEFRQVLREGMPSGNAMPFEVVSLERGLALLRLKTGPEDLRPGETVAGPLLFAFADLAMYAAVMSVLGKVPLAVTTDATIHFLRRPQAGILVARAPAQGRQTPRRRRRRDRPRGSRIRARRPRGDDLFGAAVGCAVIRHTRR